MAMWHIQRIEQPPIAQPSVDCLDGAHPVRVFLVDLLSGARIVQDYCQANTDGDGCGLIGQIVASGHTPTDSNAQCGI